MHILGQRAREGLHWRTERLARVRVVDIGTHVRPINEYKIHQLSE